MKKGDICRKSSEKSQKNSEFLSDFSELFDALVPQTKVALGIS